MYVASPGFNFNGRRLRLALEFREPQTAKQAARAIGAETGSVFGLIQRMTAEGILEPIGLGKPTRGTEYRLTEDAAYALTLELEREDQPQESVGTVTEGQEVLIARGGPTIGTQRVFANPSISAGTIAWAASLGGDWLIALSVEAAKFDAQRLVVDLEKAGCKVERGQVDSKVSGSRLREQAISLVGEELAR